METVYRSQYYVVFHRPDDAGFGEQERILGDAAIRHCMKNLGDGYRLIDDASEISRRADLDGNPWQLCRTITVERDA